MAENDITNEATGAMRIREILERLPHKPPALMVDRVLSCVPGEYAVTRKCVSVNEDWAVGHYPGNPIFPGYLLAEAMKQACAIIFLENIAEGYLPVAGRDKIDYRGKVTPGDVLEIEARVKSVRGGGEIIIFEATAKVDGVVVATADITGAMVRAIDI